MSLLADELAKLRALKDEAEEIGRKKTAADNAFKKQQAYCIDRMEAEKAKSFRGDTHLFTCEADKVKGRVEDRRPYIRWALENDESVIDFVDRVRGDLKESGVGESWLAQFEEEFFDAITNTSIVKFKEDGHVTNQQANSHVHDNVPLPPGLTFDPAPSISMRKS